MYRQGDVLMMAIDESELPTELVPAPRDAKGRLVLARGEATGHAHVITGDGLRLLCLPDDIETMFAYVDTHARLSHEEHGPIALPKGWYRVIRQREYLPGAVRPVAD